MKRENQKLESRNQNPRSENQKLEGRNQNSPFESSALKCGLGVFEAPSRSWARPVLLSAFYFLISNFLFLIAAHAATHIAGVYSLGSNPSVMATVNGHAEYGLVFAQRSQPVTYNNIQYGNNVVNAYLDVSGNLNDGNGNLWVDLVPNANATPAGTYYVVTFNIQGAVHSELWMVPDQASVSVNSIRQASPPAGGGSSAATLYYQTLQQAGTSLAQRPTLNFSGSGVSCADNSGAQRTDCTITGGGGGGGASFQVNGTDVSSQAVINFQNSVATNGLTLTQSNPSLGNVRLGLSGTLNDAGLTSAYSGVGSCTNQVVTGLARNASPTCTTLSSAYLPGALIYNNQANTFSGSGSKQTFIASTTSAASVNLPSGAAPSTPASGDFWNQSGTLKFFDGSTAQSLLFQSRNINTTSPLAGGGNLSGDVTLTCSTCVTNVTANSPLASSGGTTPAISFSNQNAHLALIGPTSGSAAPTFRALTGSDLPTPTASTLGGIQSFAGNTHQWISSISTSGVPSSTQPTLADLAAGASPSGTFDFSGATLLKIPVAAGFTTNSNGGIGYDSTSNVPHIAVNSADAKLATFTGTPTTGNCVKWISATQIGDQGSACGSGGSNHNLLSATHPDTTPASVVRGDLITGQGATPAWARLAKGTAGQCLQMDGTATDIIWGACATGGSGITTLNTLNASTQTFATGSSGTDFNISSATSTHTFNIPDASATARGLVTTGTQTFSGAKTFSSPLAVSASSGNSVVVNTSDFVVDSTNHRVGIGTATPSQRLDIHVDQNAATSFIVQNQTSGTMAEALFVVGQHVNESPYSAVAFDVKNASNAGDGIFTALSANLLAWNGLTGGLLVGTDAAAPLTFFTGGHASAANKRWQITSAGHFITPNDNTNDIGASGATRPRTGYFGTSVVAPTLNATTGFQVNGAAASGQTLMGNGTQFVATNEVRSVTYLAGDDNAASPLADADDQPEFWANDLGRTYRITRVRCKADADNSGASKPRIQLTNGTNNIFTDNSGAGVDCAAAAWTTGTISASYQDVTADTALGFVMVTAGGYAKRVTVSIQLTAQ